MQTQVAIIGGGAAGLCAAVALKQRAKTANVVLLERLPRVGKKLLATGNGRCNITNRDANPARWHGQDPAFCRTALERYDRTAVQRFFGTLGVEFTYDEQGRAYPYSLQAGAVVDALRFAAEELGVRILTDCLVEKIIPKKQSFVLEFGNQTLTAQAVLAAGGLTAGGAAMGCDGGLLRLLKALGFATIPQHAAIVQVKTETDVVRQLKGIKINGISALYDKERIIRKEAGEILFCDYGLSGPPILQLSRAVEQTDRALEIGLDLMPEYSEEQVTEMLCARAVSLQNRTAENFFVGLLQKRVGQVLLKSVGVAAATPVSALDAATLQTLARQVKDWRFQVTGTTGMAHAQVATGGLSTDGFLPETMMAKRLPGLFAAGEILDVDGDCGGFNLQWAWASAMTAADGIRTFLGEFE